MKKRIILWLCLGGLIGGLLVGCANSAPSSDYVLPDCTAGGYEIRNENLCFVTMNVDGCKYSRLDFYTKGQTMELYADQDEVILIDRSTTPAQYYREDAPPDAPPTCALTALVDRIHSIDFHPADPIRMEQTTFDVLEGSYSETIPVQEQIEYTQYTLTMTWVDGQTYEFGYLVYADGATLMTADAPIEMHPLITPDTKWALKLEDRVVVNAETGEEIPFAVTDTTTGRALSPNGGTAPPVTKETAVVLYVDPETRQVHAVRSKNDTSDYTVTLLHQPQITQPDITEDMVPLPPDAAQMTLAVMSVMEALQ